VRGTENPPGTNNAKKPLCQTPEPAVGESREKPNTIGEGGVTPSQDECLKSKEDIKDTPANQNSKQLPAPSPAPDFEQAFAAVKDGKSREKSKFLIDAPLVDGVERSSVKGKSHKTSKKDKHSPKDKDKHNQNQQEPTKEPQTPKTALGSTPVNDEKPVKTPKMQVGVPVKVQLKDVPPKEDKPKSQFLDGVAANGTEGQSIFLVPK